MLTLLWQQPVILPVEITTTAERWHPATKQDKYNFYTEDAITMEEALLLWMKLQED
jgi:hypothetical protein